LLNLNPKIIGWKYLLFQVARLTQDQTLQDDSKSEEVVAGDVRKISAANDPNYDWVGTHWEGNPIEIPLKADAALRA